MRGKPKWELIKHANSTVAKMLPKFIIMFVVYSSMVCSATSFCCGFKIERIFLLYFMFC